MHCSSSPAEEAGDKLIGRPRHALLELLLKDAYISCQGGNLLEIKGPFQATSIAMTDVASGESFP